MNCNDGAEYVSALCDGETVPPATAEHIGVCAACRERLNDYLALGAELRRVASLAPLIEVAPPNWHDKKSRSNWWSKGREPMRIPRFAFASLLLVIIALGSGLVLVRARAQSQGSFLMLTIKRSDGTVHCAFALREPKRNDCGFRWQAEGADVFAGMRLVSGAVDGLELGIRTKVHPKPGEPLTVDVLPETVYPFTPGRELTIDPPGAGRLVITGELLDHMPPQGKVGMPLDPEPGELRVFGPILIRGKQVIGNMASDLGYASATARDPDGVLVYFPESGLWTLCLSPLEGAIEAKIQNNLIKFELEGQSYVFTTGAPISRNERIWVLHDPTYKPTDHPGSWFIAGARSGRLPLKTQGAAR